MRTFFLLLFTLGFCTLQAQSYPIGNRVITYQDPARSNRNIQTYLYYPATAAGSNTAVATGSFPIVVIGHGFVMNYAPYVVYADSLAPRGYIVAIVNTETGIAPSHTNYGLDLAFIVAKLYAENSNAASPFFQHVNPTACIMGHSMGGGCTILGSAGNANVTCTATFALAETNPSAIAAATNVTAPSLVFSGSDDCVAPAATNQTLVYNNLPGCKSFVSITDGGHCGFGTLNFNCNFGEMTCNPGGPSLGSAAQQTIVMQVLKPWLDHHLKGDPTAGSLYATALSALAAQSKITFLNPCGALVLPVEVSQFKLSRLGDGVVINWETSAEERVAYFTVEKSQDGISFGPFMRQLPRGAGSRYAVVDKEPFKGLNYYRLQMTDEDGSTQYTAIQSIHLQHNKSLLLTPNPSAGVVQLLPEAVEEQPVELQVYDRAGSLVKMIPLAEYAWQFPDAAPAGLYFCYWLSGDGRGNSQRVLLER